MKHLLALATLTGLTVTSGAYAAESALEPMGGFESATREPLHLSAPRRTTPDQGEVPAAAPVDARAVAPITAYTYSAQGVPVGKVGAQGFGLGLFSGSQKATLGGGVTVWGSPMQRLTLVGDAQRNWWGQFSPSAAAMFRIAGSDHGWSLAGLGKFKVDGFASGPNKDEIESELELGALVSFASSGWHLDANAIAGRGLGDDGEMDAEARLRFGRDLGELFRLSLDSQARLRVGGPRYLQNGKTYDFAGGPQLSFGSAHFYGAFTAGPGTVGMLSDSVGFSSMLCLGGTN